MIAEMNPPQRSLFIFHHHERLSKSPGIQSYLIDDRRRPRGLEPEAKAQVGDDG